MKINKSSLSVAIVIVLALAAVMITVPRGALAGKPHSTAMRVQSQDFPPAEVNPKTALLGRAVVHIFRGHQVVTVLSRYDESNDTYEGHVLYPESIKARKLIPIGKGNTIDGEENVGLVFRVTGLRAYPYSERPDYAFQFVWPGQDTEPLLEIARRNSGN